MLLAVALVGCSSRSPAPAESQRPPGDEVAPARSEPPPVPKRAPTVILTPPSGEPIRVAVEIARSEEERRRGLMYRQNLPPDAGMLFLFEEDEIHSFWMKNTLIPLDMIFIRADGTVAGVVENATPRTLEPRGVDRPSRHVLEVIGGWARAHGVGEGTRVSFENIDMTGLNE
jgi:uncharacterized membrane protein (UPF0127 family)